MTQNQKDFVDFMLRSGALKFGDFTLKSGRKSPFFMNTGIFNEGDQLYRLGWYYAAAIYHEYGRNIDVLFGPAYKGIPLAVATTMILSHNYGLENVRYCSNRKEVKDHGDAGILLGTKLKDGDRVVMIEDVTTSGKSMEETVPIVRSQAKVEIVGLMVSLDRHEVGPSGTVTALEEVSQTYGFPTAAIISMPEVVDYMAGKSLLDDEQLAAISNYYAQYGPKKQLE